jgi:hypothetical protein
MKKLFETLEALKPSFIEGLNYQLFWYTTIGSGTSESPMWIQMDSIWGDVELKFVNSQKTSRHGAFHIPVDKEAQQLIKDYRDECYDYFKYVKYTHIKEVAPTVWAELATGFNGARISSFMNSYVPLNIVEKKSNVQQLLDNGQLTIEELMEYAQNYMDACDQLDDEQIDKHTYNLEWESNDLDAPDYEDTQDVEWPNHVRSSSPEYIIASTSFRTEETYVFEADRDGKILDYGEYGGIAKRWEVEDWTNHELAVREAFDVPYRFERKIETGMNDVLHFLYSKVTPADYWDGE